MPLADEERLIERARAYDHDAVAQLYRAHVHSIFRYVSLRVGDTHTAEDLTSEVFIRALEGLRAFEYRGVPFSAWLYRIARDRIVDHYRRRDRCPEPCELSEWLADACEQPHDAAVRAQEEAEIRAALAELTEDQRMVVALRFIEHLSLADVARQLGKTEGAVKSLQHRALAAMSRILEGTGNVPTRV